MPKTKESITSLPPPEVAAELAELAAQLDDEIPARTLDRNLLVATWNIRSFSGLTEKWISGKNDSPRRDLHAVSCIAEIVSRFDVVALQELQGDLRALRVLLQALGPAWGLILTDVTKGDVGNRERIGFVFDTRRVTLSGLACELVVPPEDLDSGDPDALGRQFARTPYAVGFRSLNYSFTLVALHVIWGDDEQERFRELKAIADWMVDWARDKNAWDRNLIVLGDFNIASEGSDMFKAFTSTGLQVPDDLRLVRRSIFDDPANPERYYDQIAWFAGQGGAPPLSMRYVTGGSFDFTRVALRSRKLSKSSLSFRISDHLPLWAEFSMRE
jgi:endonuclease/exonuclease/phosphatase family metal-dependent hydrolase